MHRPLDDFQGHLDSHVHGSWAICKAALGAERKGPMTQWTLKVTMLLSTQNMIFSV
jgi:hypothetical protein